MNATDYLRALSASVLLAVLCICGWCVWQLLLLIKDFGRIKRTLEKDRDVLRDGICRQYREYKKNFGKEPDLSSKDHERIRHFLNLELARKARLGDGIGSLSILNGEGGEPLLRMGHALNGPPILPKKFVVNIKKQMSWLFRQVFSSFLLRFCSMFKLIFRGHGKGRGSGSANAASETRRE